MPSLVFRVINPFKKKKNLFTSTQLDFGLNLFTSNPKKFDVAKVKESFPISRFAEVTFRNLTIFGQCVSQMPLQDVFVT